MPGQRVQIFLYVKYFPYPNGRVFHCKNFINNHGRVNTPLGKGPRVSLSQLIRAHPLKWISDTSEAFCSSINYVSEQPAKALAWLHGYAGSLESSLVAAYMISTTTLFIIAGSNAVQKNCNISVRISLAMTYMQREKSHLAGIQTGMCFCRHHLSSSKIEITSLIQYTCSLLCNSCILDHVKELVLDSCLHFQLCPNIKFWMQKYFRGRMSNINILAVS